MTAIPHERDTLHRWALEQLPFEVNGTIAGVEAQLLQAHLAECPQCRARLEEERRWSIAMPSSSVEHTPHASLAKLLGRIDAEGSHRQNVRGMRFRRAPLVFPTRQLLAGAFLICALAAGLTWLLSGGLPARPFDSDFRTLSDPIPSGDGPLARVVFAEDLPAGRLNETMHSMAARIVDGPSSAGAYLIASTERGQSADRFAENLRRHPGVVFAEPILAH